MDKSYLPWVLMALVIVLCLHISLFLIPSYYCMRWGGVMYNDGECRLVEDMDNCKLPDGSIREKNLYDINWTVVLDEKG